MQITTLMSAISNICQPDLRSILQCVISRFLYREEINNMCGANRYLNELFIEDWRYVYKICLHYQPHNYDGLAIIDKCISSQFWYKEGELHREKDQPALIHARGVQIWLREGKFHREGDQPARINSNGTQEWWKEGKIHRDRDQPAIINANGYRAWWKEGKRHRDGVRPAIIYENGDQAWYKEGEFIK